MMENTTLRIVVGADEAGRTLLSRRPLDEYQASPGLQQSIRRLFGEDLTPDAVVERILRDVRHGGDDALRRYMRLIDGVELDALRVAPERIALAWERTPADLRQALERSAQRIEAFHRRQPRNTWLAWDDEGGALGQIVRPLQRVGIYAPHGTAPYPSSLLMAAVPARVAGVEEVVVTTPPRNGELNDTILAAARVAGVLEVYALGGAQAIAALAYGTESVRRVDKIMGPGNIFVVLAKRRVFGSVDIDQLPGPTETLLIADESANPAYIAADLLAQAEHDPMASAVLLTTSRELADSVASEVERQVTTLARRDIIRESLARQGGIAVVEDIDTALNLANEYAPEHLCLLTRHPWELLGRVRNAGGVFLGELSSEALGDYMVGPSHIMPTGQTARFSSPVNVWDFVKITSVFGVSPSVVRGLSPSGIRLAEEEGLTAHAEAMRLRWSDLEQEEGGR